MQTIIRNTRGRNRSKQPSEFWYNVLVAVLALIVGVAIVDLVMNNQII